MTITFENHELVIKHPSGVVSRYTVEQVMIFKYQAQREIVELQSNVEYFDSLLLEMKK